MTTEQKIQNAIEKSIRENRIVTIESAQPEEIEALTLEADDYTENGTLTEFWGTDEEGDEWRVHAER